MEDTTIPSDSNGVYSLPAGYLAETGETIQASQHNPPLEDIASSMTQRMMRSGVTPMTGAMKIVDGSAGSPAVQFSNATSTGLFKTSNGIGVSVGGTQVAEFGSGGLISGVRFIGELIPHTGSTAQQYTVIPTGQTLNRADYPALWTFAQVEIAAGNVFYNNGNGTTTFGIGDMRGCVLAHVDSGAGRLSASYFGSDPTKIGRFGGSESCTLTVATTASHFHSASIFDPPHTHPANVAGAPTNTTPNGAGAGGTVPGAGSISAASTGVRVTSDHGLDTTYSAGGGLPHNNTQPTMTCNYLLYAGA